MKRLVLVAAFTLASSSLFAGVTYDFRSATEGARTIAGKVAVDGTNMRVDFATGDNIIFRDGSSVISRDGGKSLIFIDPSKKSWSELDLQAMFASLGSTMKSMGSDVSFKVSNQKIEVRPAGDGGVVEGYPTKKYIVDSKYTLAMNLMGMKMNSDVHSVTTVWTTDKLSAEYMTFLHQRAMKTGIEDLDKLIETQSKGVSGFPLRQQITATTRMNNQVSTTKTTVEVKNIKPNVSVPAASFQVPAGYRKTDAMATLGGK